MVLVDGELTLYMERGGKTLLAWSASDPAHGAQASEAAGTATGARTPSPALTPAQLAEDPRVPAAAQALAEAARSGALGTITVERVNAESALTSPYAPLLEGAGFHATPRGLRLRA